MKSPQESLASSTTATAEQALRESEQRFRELVDGANSAIVRWRASDGTVVFVNRYAQELFGYSSEELVGRPVGHFVPCEDSHGDDLSELVRRVAEDPEQFATMVNENLCRDGRRVWCAWSNLAIRDDAGTIVEILAIGNDISEQKKVEGDLRRLNETLERQVAERTALAESRARQLHALSVKLIEAAEVERRRIAELLHEDLQQILVSARLRLEAARRFLTSTQALDEAMQLLGDSIAKAQHLTHQLSPPVLHHSGLAAALEWLADELRTHHGLAVCLELESIREIGATPLDAALFRAAQELLLNVVAHAGEERARLVVERVDDHIRLTVIDEGCGFDPDPLISMERPVGLGLLGLRERAAAMGGALQLTSAPGHGSRVTVTVPFVAAAAGEPIAESQVAAEAGDPVDGDSRAELRVLLVDDHRVLRQGVAEVISSDPDIIVVGEAENGYESLQLAVELRPDVVLMDVSMPGMDGAEATRRLKARQPAARVVALSMHDDEQISRAMRRAGADAFVCKSAPPESLLAAIRGSRRPSN